MRYGTEKIRVRTQTTGRTFFKEELFLPELICPVYLDHPATPNLPLDRMAGIVKDIEIRPDGIYGVLDIFPESRHGAIITALRDAKVDMEYQAGGLGTVDENNVVTDYMLTHVAVVAK